jgi:DNA excision repair protein ERCC-1
MQECARYIETLKAYESKPASSIMEARDTDYLGRLTAALTAIRGVNRCGACAAAAAAAAAASCS